MNLNPIRQNMNEITTGNGDKILFSYSTPVAVAYKMGDKYFRVVKTEKKWSRTTSKHITQWIGLMASAQIVVDILDAKPQEYFDNLITGVK